MINTQIKHFKIFVYLCSKICRFSFLRKDDRVLGQPRKKQDFMQKQTFSLSFVILSVVSAVSLIISNILAVKQFDINIFEWHFTSTAGLIIFPISYIINDCISEVWGYRKARFIIWISFACNFAVIALFQLSVALPPAEYWMPKQSAYAMVLSQTPRIALASLMAFLTGSFINAFVMSRMKVKHNGKYFAWRAIASTLWGEMADTFVFTTLGFLGAIPLKAVFTIILTETVLKTTYETVVLPITIRIVKYIKRHDEIDVYDHEISYNPFKLKQI